MNFHALLGKLFKVSSVLHLRVILDCLLLHFSFCFPSCFSYWAPLANSELTVTLSSFAGCRSWGWGRLSCQAEPQQWVVLVLQGCRAQPALLLARAAAASSPSSSLAPSALCFSSQQQTAPRPVSWLQLCLHGTAVELELVKPSQASSNSLTREQPWFELKCSCLPSAILAGATVI